MAEESPDDTLRETVEALQQAISEQAKACPSCGEPFPEGAAMCPHCGAVITTAPTEVPPPPPAEETSSAEAPALSTPEVDTAPEAAGLAVAVAPEPPPPESVSAPSEPQAQEAATVAEEVQVTEERPAKASAPARARSAVAAVRPVSRRRLWAAVAFGVGAYLVAVPVGFPLGIGSIVGTIPASAVMVLGAVAVATGVGLFAVPPRRVEPAPRAVVTEYVCPLCGTDVAEETTDCPTCGARLTD